MRVLNRVLFMCAVFSGSMKAGVLRNDTFRLDIVHYNDFHARFEETSVTDPICITNDTRCLGGFARLCYEIKHILTQKPDALLLNAGDDFQGTYWYTLLRDKVMSTFINMLPNDAHTLGNHEFDDGVEGLVPYLKALKDPVVVANLDVSLEPSLQGLYQPHVVLERKGRKIGIIGVTRQDTKALSNPGRVRFLDPLPIVQKEAKLLTEQGVDIIIILSHCGLYIDKEMAKTVGENVDIIVGGHTHALLWNGTAPSNGTVAGSYPEYEEAINRPGHKVFIVATSAHTKYLGNIGVVFDAHGEGVSFDAEPVFLDRNIPEDPEVKDLLEPYIKQIHATVGGVIGHTSGALDKSTPGESALGDIVTDAFVDMSKQKVPSNLTTIAFINKKMIRTFINKGDITLGNAINVLPFSNPVWVYRIQGKHVKEALNGALSSSTINLPQVSGIRLTLNTSSKSVVSILVKEGEEWKPLEDEKEYQCVTPKFLKEQSEPLNNNAKDIYEVGKDWEILTSYIKKITPITPTLDGRLVVQS